MSFRVLLTSLALSFVVAAASVYWLTETGTAPTPAPPHPVRLHTYTVVGEYPHDREARTQGLIFRDGFFYESTGGPGRSGLRKVRPQTGLVEQERAVERFHAEGLTAWRDSLVQLTPLRTMPHLRAHLRRVHDLPFVLTAIGRRLGGNTGAVYALASLERQSTFSYPGDGWGLTHDGRRLIMSDGTSRLRFLDPDRFHEIGGITVTDRGQPLEHLNELEFVEGKIYANVWHEPRIAIIAPSTGQVTAWIDLSDLAARLSPPPDESSGAVLNGIAYDSAANRLFVTGKLWPRVFEIRIRPGR